LDTSISENPKNAKEYLISSLKIPSAKYISCMGVPDCETSSYTTTVRVCEAGLPCLFGGGYYASKIEDTIIVDKDSSAIE